ncbi:unnamed protein product, partial [Trichogramma brassicae]
IFRATRRYLKKHKIAVHDGREPFECGKCHKSFGEKVNRFTRCNHRLTRQLVDIVPTPSTREHQRQHSHRPALQQPVPAAHRHLQPPNRTTPPKKATHCIRTRLADSAVGRRLQASISASTNFRNKSKKKNFVDFVQRRNLLKTRGQVYLCGDLLLDVVLRTTVSTSGKGDNWKHEYTSDPVHRYLELHYRSKSLLYRRFRRGSRPFVGNCSLVPAVAKGAAEPRLLACSDLFYFLRYVFVRRQEVCKKSHRVDGKTGPCRSTIFSPAPPTPPPSRKIIQLTAQRGMLHSGFGPTQMNKFFSVLQLPNINEKVLKSHERIVGPIVELVAEESCLKAADLERTLTIENKNRAVDKFWTDVSYVVDDENRVPYVNQIEENQSRLITEIYLHETDTFNCSAIIGLSSTCNS